MCTTRIHVAYTFHSSMYDSKYKSITKKEKLQNMDGKLFSRFSQYDGQNEDE